MGWEGGYSPSTCHALLPPRTTYSLNLRATRATSRTPSPDMNAIYHRAANAHDAACKPLAPRLAFTPTNSTVLSLVCPFATRVRTAWYTWGARTRAHRNIAQWPDWHHYGLHQRTLGAVPVLAWLAGRACRLEYLLPL